MNANSACGAIKRACTAKGKLNRPILVALLVISTAATLDAAVKIVDPLPVMVLTGYSDAVPFKGPSGLFVDRKRGDIWVADSGSHQIVAFDSQGIPLIRFRHMAIDPETDEAIPGSPESLAVDSVGEVFVVDSASDKVAMYDYRGRLMKRINLAKLLGVERVRPQMLDIDSSDNLYIVDTDLRLTVLDRDQQLIRSTSLKRDSSKQGAGKAGEESVESITAMDIGNDGKVYLLNAVDYPCVRVLEPTGKELLAFGDIDAGWDNFVRPRAVTSIDDGTFWIADQGSHIVKQFAAEGKYQQYIGGGPGSRPGEMRSPSAVATDGKDKLYVAERGTNRVQVFSLTK